MVATDLSTHKVAFAFGYSVLQEFSASFAIHKVCIHSGWFWGHGGLRRNGRYQMTEPRCN